MDGSVEPQAVLRPSVDHIDLLQVSVTVKLFVRVGHIHCKVAAPLLEDHHWLVVYSQNRGLVVCGRNDEIGGVVRTDSQTDVARTGSQRVNIVNGEHRGEP